MKRVNPFEYRCYLIFIVDVTAKEVGKAQLLRTEPQVFSFVDWQLPIKCLIAIE
jgi:hypothetical protein